MFASFKSSTTGETCVAGTACPSGAHEFTLVVCGLRIARSLYSMSCFKDRCWSFCPFSCGQYVVCSSSSYVFWLPPWYLQSFLTALLLISWACYLVQYDLIIKKWINKKKCNFYIANKKRLPLTATLAHTYLPYFT